MRASKTSDYFLIKINMPNPHQEPPESTKGPNQDLMEMDILCTYKIKIESQNLEHGCIKDWWPSPNQDQDSKPQLGTSSVLWSPKSGLKGHGFSLPLQNQDRQLELVTLGVRPVTLSKLRSRGQTLVRALQCPLKPQIRTLRTWMFNAPLK